ncbi:hypothetical protein [Myxacorys almedinensis]|uniref:Uncharacterized protein n=1 Tax=Myxacorys almedinensis A TaxID=2690445 RepID=A0A8J7Z0M0_9CYAN|nr:hypothetical protein [Myxacorys almedinensis]NDJ15938.1 hypothetical protein [Myxacorys almedinensis A]
MPHLAEASRQLTIAGNEEALANCLAWLAELYRSQGRYAEAEPSISSCECLLSALRETHPYTQGTWQSFVLLLQQVVQSDRIAELSDHLMTGSLLQKLQGKRSYNRPARMRCDCSASSEGSHKRERRSHLFEVRSLTQRLRRYPEERC